MRATRPASPLASPSLLTATLPARAWPWLERLAPWLLLAWALGFNLVNLWPEVALGVLSVNDAILHKAALAEAVDALRHGRDPTDTWLGTITLGYPLFHHYQHLAYLPPALVYLALGGAVSLDQVYAWSLYLGLSLFPLAIYASLRRLGFAAGVAAVAGLLAPLVSTNGLYGLDFVSYVWRGYGVYTQLWGMLLMPLAITSGYVALRDGRGYFLSTLLVAATLATHTVFGWITVLSIALSLLVAPGAGRFWRRGWRLALLLGLTALVAAYFLVPFALDSAYMNRSVWEAPWKYDVYGHEWTLGMLWGGGLFDFGRPSVLTVLAGVGLAICLLRWRDERYRLPVVLGVFWLLVYFGRPTWGALLDLLPLARELHFHRVIAGVHLGGIWLAGIGLAVPWAWLLARRRGLVYLAPAALVTVALLVPMYQERAKYLADNEAIMRQNRDALAAEGADLDALLATLHALPPGRVFAGRAAVWGKDYRIGDIAMYHLLNQAGLDVNGYLYHALSLNADAQVTFNDQRLEEYDLYNTRYVVAPVDRPMPEFLRPIATFGRHQLYEAPTSGYFALVAAPGALSGSRRTFYAGAAEWLKSNWPARHVHPAVFFGPVRGTWPWDVPIQDVGMAIARLAERAEWTPLPVPPRGRIVSEELLPEGYAGVVELAEPGLVMAKTAYHPHLRVTVDGERVEPLMLMPAYVGVPVPAGQHTLRLVYEPPALRPVLLALGLAVLAAIALLEWRRAQVVAWLERRGAGAVLAGARRRWEAVAAWPPLAGARGRLADAAPYLGLLGLLVIFASLPLFQLKLMWGHDTLVYLPRLVEFWEGLRAGALLPRWAPDLGAGYGEPHFIFNPPLVYYVGMIFRALGASFIAAQSLTAFVFLAAAALGMYLFAGAAFGRRGGLVAATAYLMAPYFLVALYVRHALADFAAFACLPFACWVVWRLATRGGHGALLLAAGGVAALMLTSSPVALFTVPALALLAVVLAVGARSAWPLLRGAAGLAAGLALSAFFWVPAMAERAWIHSERFYEGWLYYRDHALDWPQLLFSRWGFGYSLPGPDDGMSYAIGWLHLLVWLLALVLLPAVGRRSRAVGGLVAFGVLLVPLAAFLTLNAALPIWDAVPLLQGIVYPWRLLSLIAFATAFLAGVPPLLVSADRVVANYLTIVLLAFSLALGLPFARPSSYLDVNEADYLPAQIAGRGLYAGTGPVFEPIWVQERPGEPASTRFHLLSGGAVLRDARVTPYRYQLAVEVREPSRVRANTYYYPGWTLYVDGAERPLAPSTPQGLMEFALQPGDSRVEIVFRDTPPRAWAARVSLAALLLVLLLPPGVWLLARVQRRPARAAAARPVLPGSARKPARTR